MKTSIKTFIALLICGLGFYNLKITTSNSSVLHLSFSERSAYADTEGDSARKYYASSVTTGHESDTFAKPGGGTCTKSYDFSVTYCSGTGEVSCKPGTTISNEQSTC